MPEIVYTDNLNNASSFMKLAGIEKSARSSRSSTIVMSPGSGLVNTGSGAREREAQKSVPDILTISCIWAVQIFEITLSVLSERSVKQSVTCDTQRAISANLPGQK